MSLLFRCFGSLIAIPVLLVAVGCGSHSSPPPLTLSLLSVTPSSDSLAAGAAQQFKATATYNNGTTADVTGQAAWTTSNASVATISPSGMLDAVAAGTATVTASLNDVNGASNLTVTPPVPTKTLTSIAVTPADATFVVGATQQFTATGAYTDGSTSDLTSTATWSVSNTATATISGTGLATAIAAGTANVTASLQGVTGTTALTVTTPVTTPSLVSIAVTPATASIAAGATQQFTATGTYSDGSTSNLTSTATWSVSNTATATISGTGLATAIAAGTANVTATLQGVIGTAALTVTTPVITPSLVSIAITPASASIAAGATQQFTATGTYSDGSTSNISSTAAWSVSNTAIATISGTGLATAIAAGSVNVTATLQGITGTAALTVTAVAKTVKSLAVTPASVSLADGSTQQFTATATYTDASTANVTSTATWSIANTAVATIAANGLATAAAAGSTTVQASLSGVTASTALTVTIAPGTGVNVTTWHFDSSRSGLNPGELSLTPSNVSASTFGKLFSYQVDAYVYAQPLLVSNLTINGAARNVLYVATENDSVYAFDADTYGAPLWQVSLLQAGETPLSGAPIKPVEGITSTPVIDLSTSTLYVVSTQTSTTAPASFRLNALDLITGVQKPGSPVTLSASMPGTGNTSVNGIVSLNTSCMQRAALLEANSTIYIGFGSCQRGWLLAYDAQSLAQVGVFNSSPNLNGEGTYMSAGGIWMGGGGPAADGSGNVYIVTGNGPWDGLTAWSDSILKFNPKLQLTDWFTPDSYQYMDCADADLASGGLILIPGTSQALAGGKIGKLFLVNTTSMGHQATGDTGATQSLWFESDLITPYSSSCTDSTGVNITDINPYEVFGTAAYFNGSVYLGITPTGANVPSGVRQFTYNGTLTPGPITTPNIQENTRGTTPFISANGSNNGVLWMIDTGQPIQNSGGNAPTSAILRAYDPAHFPTELYTSATNAADTPGYGIKFSSPIVANGKVYISTAHDVNTVANPKGEIDVYGLK